MRMLVCLAGALLFACSSTVKAPLVASNIVITEAMPGRHISAGYLSLTNNTDEVINISHLTSPEFESVEIHETTLDGGVAKMRRLDGLTIAAHSSVLLQRGAKHLMLMRPNGEFTEISLNFYDGDTRLLSVVASISARRN